MRNALTIWLPVAILAALGVLAGLGRFVEAGRDADSGIPREIAVTSSQDGGPGSLRTALFMAMKAPHPVTIRLEAAAIGIDAPLPPVVANAGLVIRGSARAAVRISRTGEADERTPLLDIVADDTVLEGFTLDAGNGIGIDIKGANAELTGIGVENAAIGIRGHDVEGLTIRNSYFANNDYGIRLVGESASAALRENEFHAHRQSAVWIVMAGEGFAASTDVVVHDNRFSGGRDALIAANVVVDLRGNRVSGFSGSGFMLMDAQATVAGNRMLDSRGVGLNLRQLRNSMVVDNEIARNEQIGVLIVDADGLQVNGNQIYNNGYGIVAVGLKPIGATLRNNSVVGQSLDGLITIGESPLIDGNHALRNRHAGIRILDLLMPGQSLIEAVPRLANNVLRENGDDDVLYGEYVVEAQ